MNQDKSLKNLVLEHSKMLELLEVLRQEYSALIENNVQTFQSAAINKQQLAKDINYLEQQRMNSFRDDNIELGFDEKIEINSDTNEKLSKGIIERWLAFTQTARECQEQNLINAKIIDQNLKSVQSILNILKGQQPHQSGLYDPSGKSVDSTIHHILGQV